MRMHTRLFILFLHILLFCSSCHHPSGNIYECDSLQINFFPASPEVADKYLITNDQRIVFSKNGSDHFELKAYKDGNITDILSGNENLFNPFQSEEEISALQDFEGDEAFIPLNVNLRDILAGQAVKSIFNLPSKSLVIEMKDEKVLFLYDPALNNLKTIMTGFGKINGLAAHDNCIVISSDNNLDLYDFNSGRLFPLAEELHGEKLNPFLSGNILFFVNNDVTEYYSVYSADISNTFEIKPAEIFRRPHDIRMPKVKGDYLYYVEIINSEYLLKRTNLSTRESDMLISEGVVYNFDFYNDTLISFIYSDLNTPKSLCLYNTLKRSSLNISGTSVTHNIGASFKQSSGAVSGAWYLVDTLKPVKGIILYIHPGFHSDFSPRWDNLLMNLCENGYGILGPNYPGSCGFGKSYTGLSEEDAVRDLIKWKEYIQQEFKDKPVYCLSASSGNMLMERLLTDNYRGILAAASLFGVAGSDYDYKCKIPSLYILGENDPVVNYNARYSRLASMQGGNKLKLISYSDEGHWFRKKKNSGDAIGEILRFFCCRQADSL